MSMSEDRLSPAIRLGILAGGGSVPEEVARAAIARGWPVQVVAIDGEADGRFPGASVTTVDWGQIGRMLKTFHAAGVSHLVIVGRVSRPDLTRIKPDLGLLRALPHILRIVRSGGDDGVLRGVVRFFEGHGFQVIGPSDVAPDLVAGNEALGAAKPDASDDADIAIGLEIVRRLGPYDVGQSVAVRSGSVLAIEGAEGTDRMLSRVSATTDTREGVLVKRPKPQQDLRVDMPAIGPETVSRVTTAGLRGIAVLAGGVLLTQREEMIARADSEQVFVAGVSERTDDMQAGDRRCVGGLDDVGRASEIIDVLQPYVRSRSVVVAGKYVLGVETGEGVEAVLRRVAELRQWGSQRVRKRVGYVVLAAAETVDASFVSLATAAGLKGIAVRGGDAIAEDMRSKMKSAGLELLRYGGNSEKAA